MPNTNILTTEPTTELAQGISLVSFTRKSTKKNPVADADKYRAIEVPAFTMPTLAEGTDNVFAVAIREAFDNAAGEILRDYVDSNKGATEVDVSLFTFAAVVAKMQAQATSQRLNQETIAAWYDSSETAKDAAKRYEGATMEKKTAALKSHYLSLASNNPGISPELATKMISYINANDVTNATAKVVLQRLEKLSKKVDTSEEL